MGQLQGATWLRESAEEWISGSGEGSEGTKVNSSS